MDVSAEEGATACVVLCLQETKLLQVRPPHRYIVENCPRTGKNGGGIATLILLQVPIMKSVKEQCIVYTQLAADKGVVLHILNIYIPPHVPKPTQLH